jgi:hypothetical protein
MPVAKTLMALCASLVTLTCYAKEPQMSNTKTYCIGRYLVDLPADAQINGQSYNYKYGAIESYGGSESEGAFVKEMDEREAQLKAGKHRKGYALISVRRPSPSITIFQLSRQLLMGPSIGFEAHRWDKGRSFMLQQTGTIPAEYETVLTDVQINLLPNLHAREQDDTPSAPGFCLKDGFIANDGAHTQRETAGMSFRFAQWPGVLVTFQTMTVTKLGEPKLLQRMDSGSVPDALKSLVAGIRILRRGERAINGRDGEEMLSTVPSGHGYHLHQFRWEAQGTSISDPLKPTLIVELESGMTSGDDGEPVRPKLTDEQAIAIFDAVANSVRLRPVGDAKVSDAAPAAIAPLGTLAQTGTPCPQTGWWTCPEAVANRIEGGRRQRFEAGTAMPVVQVLAKQSFIERMTGRQQKHSINTVWKLVAYDGRVES